MFLRTHPVSLAAGDTQRCWHRQIAKLATRFAYMLIASCSRGYIAAGSFVRRLQACGLARGLDQGIVRVAQDRPDDVVGSP